MPRLSFLPRLVLLLVALLVPPPAVGAAQTAPDAFVRVHDGRFQIGGEPYHFAGVNFWYGMNLGMEGAAGDRARLRRELDRLRALGVTNLRIMGATEGPNDEPWRVAPAAQPAPGEYDARVLRGLDVLLAEMAQRDMRAVLILNNFFQWSGGMAQYVSWATGEPIPYPEQDGNSWTDFQNFSARFYAVPAAQELWERYVRALTGRVNHLTGVAYRDDPTIMSWQLSNEPRGFAHSEAYVAWVERAGALLRREAPRQLVSLGGEGKLNPTLERTQFERVSRLPVLDYLTVHIWIENWGWYDPAHPAETMDVATGRALGYLADHVAVAEEVDKPLVLEEFGVSRDGRDYAPTAPVTHRDRFYRVMLEAVLHLASQGSPLVGANLWSWAGEGSPVRPGDFWRQGEPFTGDPPHERQGWYSIYAHDASTLEILRHYAERMARLGATVPTR